MTETEGTDELCENCENPLDDCDCEYCNNCDELIDDCQCD